MKFQLFSIFAGNFCPPWFGSNGDSSETLCIIGNYGAVP